MTWDDLGVLCDECSHWFHINCQNVHSAEYSKLDHSSVVWACLNCNSKNYSHTVYNYASESLGKTNPNKYSPIKDISLDSLDGDVLPKYESSPIKRKQTRQKGQPLRLINVNCQSLSSKNGPWKNLITSSKPDIIIATETWLTKDICNGELEMDDYQIYRRDRVKGAGGGVLIAISKTLNSSVLPIKSESEILWVRVILQAQPDLIVGACYRPHVSDQTTIPALTSNADEILAKSHKNMIIGGDFNLPGIDWSKQQLKPQTQYVGLHQDFIEFTKSFGFSQLVDEPTRLHNTLDLLLTNIPERINHTKILPGISDHNIPFTELSLRTNRRKQATRKIYLYKQADWEGLNQHIQPLLEPLEHSRSPVEEIWEKFKTILQEAANKYIPTKLTKSRPSRPWISKQLDAKIKLRDRLHKKSKDNGKAGIEERHQQMKKEVQRELRQEHNAFVEAILTDNGETTSTNKRFWNYVKNRRSDNSGIGTLKVGSKLITDPTEKAEALNQHFKSVFTTNQQNQQQDDIINNNSTMPHITVATNGVYQQLRNLNHHKATGPDNLSARLLKETAHTIAPTLRNLFQLSLDRAVVPKDWRHARVCAIYKKGNRYEPANYRPISITCLCSKILEHIVTSQMMSYLEGNQLLHNRQHGFRSKRSCESQLIELTSQLSELLDQGKEVDAIVLDFSKAFDKVNHSKLIQKTNNIGVNSQVVKWISSFLSNRTQEVAVDGFHSNHCSVTSGVPQGSVIGPSLFLIYINDLPSKVNSEVRLFADDTVIYTTTDKKDQLQKDLKTLEEWELHWDMEFNPSKCEHITFGRKRSNRLNNSYTLHNVSIPRVQEIKYLGVKLEHTLRWNSNTDYVTGKAAGKVGFIRRTIPPSLTQLRDRAYQSLVRPILEYSSTVWGSSLTTTQETQFEAVQRKAARTVYNIPRTDHKTSTTGLISDLQWDTLKERRRKRCLGIFRAMHFGEVATNINNFLTPFTPSIGYSRRHSLQYTIPHCNTKSHQKSFFIATAKDWNALPIGSPLLHGPPVAG